MAGRPRSLADKKEGNLHLHLGQQTLYELTISHCQKKEKQYIAVGQDVHRTKCQAQKMARLTHSPYTTKIARIPCTRAHFLSSVEFCFVELNNVICVRRHEEGSVS